MCSRSQVCVGGGKHVISRSHMNKQNFEECAVGSKLWQKGEECSLGKSGKKIREDKGTKPWMIQEWDWLVGGTSTNPWKIRKTSVLGTALAVFSRCNPPWLRLSDRPWNHKPLRRQSLSPWQGQRPNLLYFTLLSPEPDQLANDR